MRTTVYVGYTHKKSPLQTRIYAYKHFFHDDAMAPSIGSRRYDSAVRLFLTKYGALGAPISGEIRRAFRAMCSLPPACGRLRAYARLSWAVFTAQISRFNRHTRAFPMLFAAHTSSNSPLPSTNMQGFTCIFCQIMILDSIDSCFSLFRGVPWTSKISSENSGASNFIRECVAKKHLRGRITRRSRGRA